MIDSGSRSQVRPLESFKRSRFGLLAIASFIIVCCRKQMERRGNALTTIWKLPERGW